MRQTGWEISYEGDWFEVNETLFTYSEEEQEENRIAKNNAALVLRPKFIPLYPILLQKGYSLLEAGILWFIDFFLQNNERFYCTNEQLAELFNCSEPTVSSAIKSLEKRWDIKVHRKPKANGWLIRFLTLENQKIWFSEIKKFDWIYNNIIDNNIIEDTYRDQNQKIWYIELDNTHMIPTTQPLDSFPSELVVFLRDSYQNYPSTRYQIDKQQWKYVDTMIKDYNYLCKEYGEDTVKTVLAYIKQDIFRKNQIQSISKLRKKNKDWIPYIVVMMEKIQQFKPKIMDLDNMQ